MSTYVVTTNLHTPGQKYECLEETGSPTELLPHSGFGLDYQDQQSAAAVRDEFVGCLDNRHRRTPIR